MVNTIPSPFSDKNFLSDDQLQKLAHELARNLRTPVEVFNDFGITPEIFAERIQPNEMFTQYYAESYILWNGTANLPDRVKTKAAMMFEEFMPEAHRILHDPLANLPPKVQLAMFIGKIAGLEPQGAIGGAAGAVNNNNKVHVTINLSHGRQIVIEKQLDKEIEGEAVDITPTVSNTSFTGTPAQAPKAEGEMSASAFDRLPKKPGSF